LAADTRQISNTARQAVAAQDWARVGACAMEIGRQTPADAEGPFLMGLVHKAARRAEAARESFQRALTLDDRRYDAAIELASQCMLLNRYDEARSLLLQYRERLVDNSLYLDMAGQTYFDMGHYEEAWSLLEQACLLQPDVETYQTHLAACAVYLGKADTAKAIYVKLLKRHPRHQKTHYELAQLARARNDAHIKQMLKVLQKGKLKPESNVYLYYALGKEYEDLGKWSESFRYYEMAGSAVKTVADYDVASDVGLMDRIVETCSASWLQDSPAKTNASKTPIFIVGLPRTGTTLTDRILSSHSEVQSVGESQLLQMVLRDGSRAGNQIGITPSQIEKASRRDPATIAAAYTKAVAHRLGDEPYFIEKFPENVLYLGLIAKAWPDARIVHLRRHPMDACFAVFKQSFFRFAYSLDDLAEYYLAYDRLSRHWRETLGARMLELNYEDLVTDQESQTRQLLQSLGLDFEEACLHFEQNAAPVATASSVQVREKVHTRSVEKWRKFEKQLQPLRERLEQGGVTI
jgi:tetratricopeptide (TPR) repeat protein